MTRKLCATTLTLLLILAQAVPAGGASRLPLRANHGMVASSSGIASQIGVDVMKRGGNAIDAAVAVAFALAVTWPSAGNVGGGGFMLIRLAGGASEVIDYRERAPLAATRDMYLDENGKPVEELYENSYLAVAVPGTVAGLALAHRRHGKLPWRELVEPAVRLARKGFTVNDYLARSLSGKRTVERLSRFPESRRIFLRDGRHYQAGERFRQPELAATLSRIARKGPREFYEGETARLIVEDMKANGGIITLQDLREYEPALRQPLRGTYRDYELLTMPPPSSGGTALLQMLNMLEHFDLRSAGNNSASYLHLLVEAMRRAYADRAAHLGDADFVRVPVSGLISKPYAAERAKTIRVDAVTSSSMIGAGDPLAYEAPSTTHFSVVDKDGNAVANTYTLEDSYGVAATVRGAGFLLNNEMGDFAAAPGLPNAYGLVQGEANAIAPRKRPLSSMTPTMVLKEGKTFLIVGSPGGGTIINTVLQVILNVVEFGMDLQQAIDAPRIHHQWLPDEISWEPMGVNPDTRRLLEARGHKFREQPGYSDATYLGDVQGIMIDPRTGARLGASDPRRGGMPAGY